MESDKQGRPPRARPRCRPAPRQSQECRQPGMPVNSQAPGQNLGRQNQNNQQGGGWRSRALICQTPVSDRQPGIAVTSEAQLVDRTKELAANGPQEHQTGDTKPCSIQRAAQELKEALPCEKGNATGKILLDVQADNAKRQESVGNASSHSMAVSTKGARGHKVQLKGNYFHVERIGTLYVYQYNVEFSPNEDSTLLKRQMLFLNISKLGPHLFDGSRLLSPTDYGRETYELSGDYQGQMTTIRLQPLGRLDWSDRGYVRLCNQLLRICLDSLGLQLVGHHYYELDAKIESPQHNLELWLGYITSIRHHEGGALLCTRITHKVMRLDTAYDLLISLRGSMPVSKTEAIFAKKVIGTIVLTDYNNKTYRIDAVDWHTKPRSRFTHGAVCKSYCAYYKERYCINIRDMEQPMLVSYPKEMKRADGSEAPIIHLVPELCRMTGLTDKMRSNFSLMQDLAKFTRKPPSERLEKLQNFNHKLYTNEKVVSALSTWNLELQNSLVSLPGRVLPQETIYLKDRARCAPDDQNDWSRQIRGKGLLRIVDVPGWTVIFPSSCYPNVQKFVKTLREAALSLGMELPVPQYKQLEDSRPREYKLKSYIDAIDSAVIRDNPKILLVVLENNDVSTYGDIKKRCIGQRSVPSQFLLQRSLKLRNLMSIATKVAIQMNCKLGGAPWTVNVPLKSLMVVGFDVYHETSRERSSIGVMVASQDKELSSYFTAVNHHSNGDWLSKELAANVCRAVRRYKQQHNELPKTIFVYRDGVGEGQINYVMEQEVQNLRTQLQKLYLTEECKIAFIIVSKRINTRLYYEGHNPSPGTIVDDVLTLPDRYDFFLVSQSVRQGTVSPTSYHVIYDSTGLTPDQVQVFTYKLTHLYYNWSGTVRVPAPVLYAHKLAYLIGQATHSLPSEEMQERLYFL